MNKYVALGMFAVFALVPLTSRAETVLVASAISADTTWTKGNVYVIDSNFVVAVGATLTLEAGTIVKGKTTGMSLPSIYGRIVARGTGQDPVYITSFYNDLVGGDTDGSGDTGLSQGEWQGLYFKPGSEGVFEYADISYSGYGGYGYGDYTAIENSGVVHIKNSRLHDNFRMVNVWGSGPIKTGSAILNKGGDLYIEGSVVEGSSYGIYDEGGNIEATSTTFKDNFDSTGFSTGYGIYASGSGRVILKNNTFQNNDKATLIDIGKVFIHVGNTSSDHKERGFGLFGTAIGDAVIEGGDLPIILDNGLLANVGTGITVRAGTLIKGRQNGSFLVVGGVLNMEGTKESPVVFTSIHDDTEGGDTNNNGSATKPEDSHLYKTAGIQVGQNAKAYIKNLKLKYSGSLQYVDSQTGTRAGLVNIGGEVLVEDSIVTDHSGAGIQSQNASTTVLRTTFDNSAIPIHLNGGSFTVAQSRFIPSPNYQLQNYGSTVMDARNNWWGDASGPYHETLNPTGKYGSIQQNIDFIPWLTTDPASKQECCSSVVFIPGIKGSILKMSSSSGGERVWPPTVWSNDMDQMLLTEDGASVNDIVVDGVLNSFYGTPIYQEFSSFMDGLTNGAEGERIKEWFPLAYDWRFAPDKILTDKVKTPSGNIDVLQKIKEMAERSNTGKVTIISHSMGGLLAKEIVSELEKEGKGNIIDALVMVGVPQLGTPQAVASLLHGDGEGIAGGIIVDRISSRQLGNNMQSAYNLLPSKKYFDVVSDPVAKFAPENFTSTWRNLWGENIDSYAEQKAFLSGADGRQSPHITALLKPEVLSGTILDRSELFHSQYDNFIFPDSLKVVQIAGWGLPTLKSVEYKRYHFSDAYRSVFTIEGDGTVVAPSATASNAETYYFNLDSYRESYSDEKQHRDLLSAPPLKNVVENIIKNHEVDLSNLITLDKPIPVNSSDMILVSSHSPVILGVYDSVGHYTGVEQGQDLSQPVLKTKQDIPGSYFETFGDAQYVFVPKTGTYRFVFKGTDTGVATIEVESLDSNTQNLISSFTDINVNANTSAELVVNSTSPDSASINVDANSDGKTDMVVAKDDSCELALRELMYDLRVFVSSLNISDKAKKNLIKQIDNIEKKILKYQSKKDKKSYFKNTKPVLSAVSKLVKEVSQKKKNKITDTDINKIVILLEQINNLIK